MQFKTWRYHKDHEPRIFDSDDVEKAELEGWKDSPAKCEGFLEKVAVDPEDKIQIQIVGEITEATTEIVNLTENIDTLDRQEIIKLAQLQLQEDWSKKRGLEKMRQSLERRIA